MKISCIIVENDPDTRNLLEAYISATSLLELKGAFITAAGALEYLRTEKTGIIFTDISLQVFPGISFAELLPKGQKFVFTTAFEECALNSFKYHVVDFLVKPICAKRFSMTIEKIGLLGAVPTDAGYMLAKHSGQVIRINFDEIVYIKGEREYVGIHFSNKRVLIYKRMKEMEHLLPDNFKRVHLSFIINTNYLTRVVNNHVITGDEKIPIGLSYRPMFHHYLNGQVI